MPLVGMELLTEFVESIVFTGFLKNDDPLSAMLIASPESGKTSVVSDKDSRSVIACSDLIGSGLIEELARKPHVRHVVINDMIAVMAHKPITNQKTWAIMSALMDEGLGKIMLPGDLAHDFGGRKAGFICCIPSEIVGDQRRWWNNSGFTSRTIPFNYEYSHSLQLRIKKEVIVNGAYEKKKVRSTLGTPVKKSAVVIPDSIANRLQKIADDIATQNDEKGLRKGKQIRCLARAHALMQKRDEVGAPEIEFLLRVKPYMSYSKAEELRNVAIKQT